MDFHVWNSFRVVLILRPEAGLRQYPEFFEGGEPDAAREDVVVALFDAEEEAAVDFHEGPEGGAGVVVDEVEEGAGVVVVLAGAAALEAEEFAEFGGGLIEAVDAEVAEFIGGEVNAMVVEVFADIAEDIGELEGDAAFFGEESGAGVGEFEDMDDGEADDTGDEVAVAVEVVEGFDLRAGEVAGDAIDHFMEEAVRDLEALGGVGESGPEGVWGGVALEDEIEVVAPLVEGFGGGVFAIGEVVAAAHEGVDGAHGEAFMAGEEEEGVVEIAGAAAGDGLAVGVGLLDGDHAARVTRTRLRRSRETRSSLEMAGRARRTL
jgi:hypothetical protein